MSQTASQPNVEPAGDGAPPHRYTPALAQQIELSWQDRWAAEGTFHTPNPTGRLSEGFERVADVQACARGVREHVHREELGAVGDLLEALAQPAGRVGRVEGALSRPPVLPVELDPLGQGRRVPVRRHVS